MALNLGGMIAGTIRSSSGCKKITTSAIFLNLIVILSHSVIISASSASAFVSTTRPHSSKTPLSSFSSKGRRNIARRLPPPSILLSSSNSNDYNDDDDRDTPLNELETMRMMNMANLCSSSEDEDVCTIDTKQEVMQKLGIEKNILDIRLFRFDRLIKGLKSNNHNDDGDDDDDDADDYNRYDYGPIPVPVYNMELMCLLNNAELCIQENEHGSSNSATTDTIDCSSSNRIHMIDELKYHKHILSYRVFKMNELIQKLSYVLENHPSVDILSLLDEIDKTSKKESLEKEKEVDSFLHAIENSLFAEKSEEDIESLLDEISDGLFGSLTKKEEEIKKKSIIV